MAEFLFVGFGLFAVFGALGLVLFKAPINSALSFMVCLLSIAGLFSMLSSQTLFLVQIVVYAGAIMILFVFVIMYFNVQEKEEILMPSKTQIILSLSLLPIIYLLVKNIGPKRHLLTEINFGDMQMLGFSLFSNWGFTFELISVLLLTTLVGVVAIAHKKTTNA